MEKIKLAPQINKRYVLRCGLNTGKLRYSNNGTNYKLEAIVKYDTLNCVFSWLIDGSYLASDIQNRFDIIEELI